MDLETDAMVTSPAAQSELALAIAEIDEIVDEINRLEVLLAEQKDRLTRAKTHRLPAAMQEARMKEFKTPGGRTVTTKQLVAGTWPKEEAGVAPAIAWLRDQDLLGLVKTTITAEFDKGDHAEAERFFAEARRISNAMKALTMKESVHSQTLNAMLRERMARGLETPLELFNGFTTTVAEIVEPGKRKGK